MKKRIVSICIVLCTILSNVSFATISSIQADEYFDQMTAYLYSYKALDISLIAVNPNYTVGVSSCTLQKKENNVWVNDGNLPLPSPHESGGGAFGATVNYSSYINGTGTFRIRVRIYAITDSGIYQRYIYSNQQTF